MSSKYVSAMNFALRGSPGRRIVSAMSTPFGSMCGVLRVGGYRPFVVDCDPTLVVVELMLTPSSMQYEVIPLRSHIKCGTFGVDKEVS